MEALATTRFSQWQWAFVAALAGLLIASLPLATSLLLVGAVAVALLVFIEPALALVAMVILAPLKTLIETEAGFPLPVDIGQLTFLAVLTAWGMHKISLRQTLLAPTSIRIFLPVVVFLVAAAFTLPGAYDVGAGINEWVKWAEILFLIYIVADFTQSHWQWILAGVVLAGVSQALIGIYEFRGGSGAPHLWILNFRYFRAFGSFGQPNPFGAFMGLILPLALGASWGYLSTAWEKRKAGAMWITEGMLASAYSVASLIILGGLLVSWSRGAWLGFAAAGAGMLWFAPRQLSQRVLIVSGTAALIGLLWISGRIPPQLMQRVTDFRQDFTGFGDVRGVVISDENYAVIERLAHWQSAIEMSKARPWLGVGFGNYEIAYPDFALLNWPLALGHAHNYYLNLMAETGLIGFTVYLIMWATILGVTGRVLRQAQALERGIALGLMGAWLHIAIHSLVDKLYVNNIFLHVGVMLGLLAVLQLRTPPPGEAKLW